MKLSAYISASCLLLSIATCNLSPATGYGAPNIFANNGPPIGPVVPVNQPYVSTYNGPNLANVPNQQFLVPNYNQVANQDYANANKINYGTNAYTKQIGNIYAIVIEQQTCINQDNANAIAADEAAEANDPNNDGDKSADNGGDVVDDTSNGNAASNDNNNLVTDAGDVGNVVGDTTNGLAANNDNNNLVTDAGNVLDGITNGNAANNDDAGELVGDVTNGTGNLLNGAGNNQDGNVVVNLVDRLASGVDGQQNSNSPGNDGNNPVGGLLDSVTGDNSNKNSNSDNNNVDNPLGAMLGSVTGDNSKDNNNNKGNNGDDPRDVLSGSDTGDNSNNDNSNPVDGLLNPITDDDSKDDNNEIGNNPIDEPNDNNRVVDNLINGLVSSLNGQQSSTSSGKPVDGLLNSVTGDNSNNNKNQNNPLGALLSKRRNSNRLVKRQVAGTEFQNNLNNQTNDDLATDDFDDQNNQNNQQQCPQAQIGPPNLYVSTSRNNYAILSSDLAQNGWLAASVNGKEVFIVTLKDTIQTGNYEALDPTKKAVLEKVKGSFLRNTQGLVLNDHISPEADTPISTNDFIRNANDGLSLPSSTKSGSSQAYSQTPAGNQINAPLASLAKPSPSYPTNYPIAGAYNNPYSNYNNYGLGADYNKIWCSKSYYENIGSSSLNNTLDGDVYYLDSYGNHLNILSSTVNSYCRENLSIVYRDLNYFTYSRIGMSEGSGVVQIFVFGSNVFLVYTDGTVLLKPKWALETVEFNIVLRARTEVKQLLAVTQNQEIANSKQFADPKINDIMEVVQSMLDNQQRDQNSNSNNGLVASS